MRSISASLLLLLPASIYASTLDCSDIRDDGQSFNLKSLAGPKTVHLQKWQKVPPTISNTTFTVDICKPLERGKGVKKEEDCASGTWICAKEMQYREGVDPFLESVVPIAGQYKASHGVGMEPKVTRLKGSASNSDEKEGVLVELHGGKDEKSGRKQKAIIEFLCDKDVSGNDGFDKERIMDFGMHRSMQRRADDDGDDSPELPDLDAGQNLQLVSYKAEDEIDVLRLRWKSKYACEGAADKGGNGKNGGGWGFFTWFLIIVFLLAAAYIIFGSWLNYNRYGARGWDLIPHGDTIRDIPYIIKDWTSGVTDRLKGQDSRGGYSAV